MKKNNLLYPYKNLLRLYCILLLVLPAFLFGSCVREESYEDNAMGNFEQLWTILDQQYCFFDLKRDEYGLDWEEVHSRYRNKIVEGMPESSLFDVLGEMLAELKDGHVNLINSGNVSRYWKWYEDYPDNFNETIQRAYLGTDYRIAGGLKYKMFPDNIGYIYYGDFSSGIGASNIDDALQYLAVCDGLIFDVRNNGGGYVTNSSKLAARFTNERVLTGYIQHKTGTGHSDFSDFVPIYLDPSNRIRWQKKVVVLTNRRSFSATNDFVNSMRLLPLVTIMGDKTGGGSGMPFSSELLNGWSVRFSSSPMVGANKDALEFGIDPDVHVAMKNTDILRGIDTIIEEARLFLKNDEKK